jgi:Cys-tRNA(Pro)/Cys-tRNA(Cys) deacylase
VATSDAAYGIAMARTPAIAAAEKAGVRYALHEYAHEPGTESYALEAAERLGVDPARLFKTLVVSIDGALAVACVPAAAQLGLKTLGKRAALADKAHAERATGYVSGGISPLGQRRALRRTSTRPRSSTRRSSSARAGAASRSSSTRATSSG